VKGRIDAATFCSCFSSLVDRVNCCFGTARMASHEHDWPQVALTVITPSLDPGPYFVEPPGTAYFCNLSEGTMKNGSHRASRRMQIVVFVGKTALINLKSRFLL
jgi:hypothetical protein